MKTKVDSKKEVNKAKKPNWWIHCIKNGMKCEISGEEILDMIPLAANFHTHGMEQYNHPDFQLVLNYDAETACYILNTLGSRVCAGERFKDGDYVKGVFEDCDVRLEVYEETGRNVLRVIIPDANNNFPDEAGCDWRYLVQLLDTEDLYIDRYRKETSK